MDNLIRTNGSDFFNILDDKKFTAEQKNQIINQLATLLDNERRNAPEFKYEKYDEFSRRDFTKRFNKYFSEYDNLIKNFFPPVSSIMLQISEKSFIDELLNYLSGLETARMSEYKINDHVCDQIFATTPHKEKYDHFVEEGSYDDLKMLIIKKHPAIKKLHEMIREAIAGAVKSPFSIVNTRAWTKPPQIRKVPYCYPTDRDFLPPGHFKIFIYLTPMNKDYGYFITGNKEITMKPEGVCILFASDKNFFKDVPGETYERFCIEITIQRTFVNLEQHHEGHPIGLHYASLNRALTEDSEDDTVIFRLD